ncbi:MAG TPA: enoyl-CoA hydratase/isomerase family protein [Solirubrobacterales bacterium]|nr:enoyl-CoA hydratase/isomerase family protein [Solirubrobacterales bacterium]
MPRTFETERTGRVLTLRFDNPPLNFMNRVMVGELDELLDSLEDDRSLGAVVITGKPEGMFITHYDIEEILAGSEGVGRTISATVAGASLQTVGGVVRLPGGRAALKRTPASGLVELQRIHEVFLRMQRMDKVFIAAINGPALGGGCEISLACDLRYMSDDARWIGLPEMTLGFCPGAGGTQRLPRLLGASRALELILEGRPLMPVEARDVGLVHRVVSGRELVTDAQGTAERLARRAPLSVAAAKRAILDGSTKPLAAGLAEERKWFMACSSQPAARRAMRAYVDRVRAAGPPFADDGELARWQDGTAVDLVSDA